MENKKNFSRYIFFVITIIFILLPHLIGGRLYGRDTMFAIVNSITKFYQIKRVVAGVIVFLYGYVILCVTLPELNFYDKIGLSAPVALALWSCVSTLILILRIPYNRTVMIGVMLLLILSAYFMRHEKRYTHQKDKSYIWGIIFGIIVLFSTGILPIIMTGDSYNYIMKYGIAIANEGSLNFSTVGAWMSWTGIASALFSSLSVFWGAENIQVFHYELIASMLWMMWLYFESERQKKRLKHREWSFIFILLIMVSPAFIYMSSYLISNTYFMAYMVITLILIDRFDDFENKREITAVISLHLIWLCISRIEAFPFICFLSICCSYKNIKREYFGIFVFPMIIIEIGLIMYIKIQHHLYNGNVVNDQYTILVLIIYAICAAGTAMYFALYENKRISWLRKKFPIMMPLVLLCLIIVLGIMNHERLVTDLSVTIKNLTEPIWGYGPAAFLTVYIIVMAVNKRIGYWDMVLWGYILFNFCLCLGRIDDLRIGIGDSYNRMLLGIVPVAIIAMSNHIFNVIEEK